MKDETIVKLEEKTNYIQADIADIKDDISTLQADVHEINTWVAVQKNQSETKTVKETAWLERLTVIAALIMMIISIVMFTADYELMHNDSPAQHVVKN